MSKRFTRAKDYYRDLPITQKITVGFLAMLVPILILMAAWFYNMIQNNNYYSDAAQTTSMLSDFGLDFKKNYDYKIYLIIVGNKTYSSQNPMKDIDEARNILDNVEDHTKNRQSQDLIDNMQHSLDNLEKYTKKIRTNVLSGGFYDANQEIWENGIQSITTLIQQNMLELLYYENLDSTQVYASIESRTLNIVAISVGTLALMFVFAVLMITYIPRTITKPVRELSKVTERVAGGDLTVRSHIEHGVELKVLSESLNIMIEKISSLIERVREEQIHLREAELEILQLQINPHFLYNTLDTIVWLAEAGNDEMVVDMVEKLSDFFRATLGGGKELVTLEEESRHIDSYLQIQRVRYQDILEYEINLPEEISQVQIPKITLQPLVENALYHGIKYKRGKGKISVYGYQQEGECVLVVEDDGRGMSPEKLEEIRGRVQAQKETEKESYGLYNVNERIRLRFGKKYGLRFFSQMGEGTKVEVHLPVRDAAVKKTTKA
ncbi:MAG: sensor histidine kinase [Eubacterium sp.]|nr:sensor histidine kinase [Eubacterium sp.]